MNKKLNRNLITKESYQLKKNKLIELEENSKTITDKLKYVGIDGDPSENSDWISLNKNLELTYDKIN